MNGRCSECNRPLGTGDINGLCLSCQNKAGRYGKLNEFGIEPLESMKVELPKIVSKGVKVCDDDVITDQYGGYGPVDLISTPGSMLDEIATEAFRQGYRAALWAQKEKVDLIAIQVIAKDWSDSFPPVGDFDCTVGWKAHAKQK